MKPLVSSISLCLKIELKIFLSKQIHEKGRPILRVSLHVSPVGKFPTNSSKKTKKAPPIVLPGWASGKGRVEVSLIPVDNLIGGN